MISDAQFIFIRAKNSNRAILNFDSKVLDLKDDRIKSIPFTTGRPTIDELKRCFQELLPKEIHVAEVEDLADQVEVDESQIEDLSMQEPPIIPKIPKELTGKVKDPINELESRKISHFNRVLDIVKRGKVNLLNTQLNATPSLGSMSDVDGNTLLHFAALSDQAEVVKFLLESGSDATTVNSRKQTPYQAATSKPVRDAFRRYIAYNSPSWEISQSFIPDPLTKEMEEKQKAKAKQKRAKKKPVDPPVNLNVPDEKMDETPKVKRGQLPRLGISLMDQVGMSAESRMRLDREKRALAAERRINSKTCTNCGQDCSLNFFEKNGEWFCSTSCIRARVEKNV
jgi:hypothetical protein